MTKRQWVQELTLRLLVTRGIGERDQATNALELARHAAMSIEAFDRTFFDPSDDDDDDD